MLSGGRSVLGAVLSASLLLGCAQGRRYVPDASADGSATETSDAGDTSGADGGEGGAGGEGQPVDAAGDVPIDADASLVPEPTPDAAGDRAPTDVAAEAVGCPADRPVSDGGLCCATGQRNCGGVCVACAAGSVCSGTSCGCPTTSQCAPAVPSGWLGPVAADLTGRNATCVAAYPTPIAAGTNPQGSAAQCACSCGACAGGTCEVFYDRYPGADCTGTAEDHGDIGGAVNDCVMSIPNGDLVGVHTTTSTTGASCAVTRSSVTKPAASWGTPASLCTGATVTPGACTGGQVCAPLTAPQKTCLYHTGATTCPAGYPVASTQYLTFSDSRDCACACNPQTAACSPTLSIIDTTDGCTADTGTPFTGCDYVFQGATHGLRINSLNVVLSGTTSFSSSGSVLAASPITVCCTN